MPQAVAKVSRRLEDYLEAVLFLVQRDGAARVRDIAASTAVSKSTVTAALKQLAQEGLADYGPYQLVRLTPKGQALAQDVQHRHDALSDFMVKVLGVDPKTAQANACRMEHVVDAEVLERLKLLSAWSEHSGPNGRQWMESFRRFCRSQRQGRET